jgi:ketosteroid isomerase-like protein
MAQSSVHQGKETFVKQSDELKKLVLELYERFSSGDMVSFVKSCYSQQDGVLAIGTDPGEWWEGYENIMEVFSQMPDGSALKIKAGDVKAYCEGTVGWVADISAFELPDGREIPFRHTVVFHKENGGWKAVQDHSSVGVPNDELFGS